MGFLNWLAGNWFTLLQIAGIVGSLLFTGLSFRKEAQARRVSNLIILTQQHREIWTQFYKRPDLQRVLSPVVDLEHQPVTLDEELFVGLLILHLNSAYYAMREGVFSKPEGLSADIQHVFSLPIPKTVWQKLKVMQDANFVRFVESSLSP